jgi:hypothetical protein
VSGGTQNPIAEAIITWGVFRGPEGQRFHLNRKARMCRAYGAPTGQARFSHGLLRPTLSPERTERSLGSSAAADLGCRLISRARLTVDPGALLIGSPIVKERYAARSEQEGHRCAQWRGERKPRLTLNHFSASVHCGNYVERKELKPCELWRWSRCTRHAAKGFVRLRLWTFRFALARAIRGSVG